MQDYIVKQGDILGRIAQQFNISLQNLLKLNPGIKDPDKIFVGQKIKVPARKRVSQKEPVTSCKIPKALKERYETALFMVRHMTSLHFWRLRFKGDVNEQKELFTKRFLIDFVKTLRSNNCPDEFSRQWMKEAGKIGKKKWFWKSPNYVDQYFSRESPDYKEGDWLIYRNYNVLSYALTEIGIDNLNNYDLPEGNDMIDFIHARRELFKDLDKKYFDGMWLKKIPEVAFTVRQMLRKEAERHQNIIKQLTARYQRLKQTTKPKSRERYMKQAKINVDGEKAMKWQDKYTRKYLSAGDPIPHYMKPEMNENTKRGQPMKENKIIQEYILKNTPQPPKDVSVIEIIADEVNETLNNLPEVQLASEILSEDELKKLFAPLAKQIVMSVHGQIGEKIKTMVREDITAAEVMNIVNNLEGYGDGDQVSLSDLLSGMSDDDLNRLKTALESDPGTNASYIEAIEKELGKRVPAVDDDNTLPAPEDEDEVETVGP